MTRRMTELPLHHPDGSINIPGHLLSALAATKVGRLEEALDLLNAVTVSPDCDDVSYAKIDQWRGQLLRGMRETARGE